MDGLTPYTINVNGRLLSLAEPRVMGILNVTPDSFYAASRQRTDEDIAVRVRQMMDEGADIIDIGAYSSRPGAADVSAQEELDRLCRGLAVLRHVAPEAVVSVDTFRAEVARACVERFGVAIVNDISGGEMSARMFDTVAELGVPYILTHMQGTPQTMQSAPHYTNLVREVCLFFAEKVQQLRDRGVKDIILDPGFGFGKTLENNYELMAHLPDLKVFELPLLVGVSRKSMIYRLLGSTPADALSGTNILNTIALLGGASILRVHDVGACMEVIKIVRKMKECTALTSQNR